MYDLRRHLFLFAGLGGSPGSSLRCANNSDLTSLLIGTARSFPVFVLGCEPGDFPQYFAT
jgi:hypothetical protein